MDLFDDGLLHSHFNSTEPSINLILFLQLLILFLEVVVELPLNLRVSFSVLNDLKVQFLDFVVQIVDRLHILLRVFDQDRGGSVRTFQEPVLVVAFFLEIFDLRDKLRDDLSLTNLLFGVSREGSIAAVEAERLIEQHIAVCNLLISQMDV